MAIAFEASRDGFCPARWLRARDINALVIDSISLAVSRECRRTKTDRLDMELLKRAFWVGWWSAGPLPNGGDPHAGRERREASGSGAGETCRAKDTHHQSNKGVPGLVGNAQLHAGAAGGTPRTGRMFL
jgi:hypothetical protein